MRVAFILIIGLTVSPVVADKVTPVQKVLQMMDDMLAKGKKEKAEEQVAFSQYAQFCKSTGAEKTRNIADGKDDIVQLKANIEKAKADIGTLSSEIEVLTGDIDLLSSQKAEALEIRATEKADFTAVHNEYVSAIDAVDRALQVLATSPGLSLAEVKDSLASLKSLNLQASAMAAVKKFLQLDQDPAEVLLEQSQ